MRQYWQRLASKIDALTLRERLILFLVSAAILVVLINVTLLDPQAVKQRQFVQRLKQDRAKIAEIQKELQQKTKAQSIDPDAENRRQLQALKQKSMQLQAALQDMQKGVVSPDKMSQLLSGILKQDSKLRLVSLKTLPVTGISELLPEGGTAVEKSQSAPAGSKTAEPVYRHGVEITVQGSYLEIMNYLKTLENLPWQLYWGSASLKVDDYPKATLVLTLFTLSLDMKWLNT